MEVYICYELHGSLAQFQEMIVIFTVQYGICKKIKREGVL